VLSSALLFEHLPSFQVRDHLSFCYCCDGVRLCLCGTAAASGPFVHLPDDTRVNIEQRWNDTDRVYRRTRRKTFPSVTLPPQIPLDWPGREHGPPLWEAGDWPPELWQGPTPFTLIQSQWHGSEVKVFGCFPCKYSYKTCYFRKWQNFMSAA
jgi:hypothetical protein